MDTSSFLLDDEFLPLLRGHELEELNGLNDSVYGIWIDHSLGYANPGWLDFAAANGGEQAIVKEWGLGRSILDSMAGEIADFYREALAECAKTGEV